MLLSSGFGWQGGEARLGWRELRIGRRHLALVAIGIITLTLSTCVMLYSFTEQFLMITASVPRDLASVPRPTNGPLTLGRYRPWQVGIVGPFHR